MPASREPSEDLVQTVVQSLVWSGQVSGQLLHMCALSGPRLEPALAKTCLDHARLQRILSKQLSNRSCGPDKCPDNFSICVLLTALGLNQPWLRHAWITRAFRGSCPNSCPIARVVRTSVRTTSPYVCFKRPSA